MHSTPSRAALARRGILALAVLPFLAGASQNIRIVTYNLADDVSSTQNHPQTQANLEIALEGIGQQKYVGDNILQLPDVIALQETYSNAITVAPMVTALNSYYNSSTYNYSTVEGTYSGNNPVIGNGPNALIYNQKTMNLMAAVGVGTPMGITNGEYRQVMRYELQPLVDINTSNGAFYVYVSHYKSGGYTTSTGSGANITTDGAVRNLEARIIRNDEAANLPATAAVLYVGDYNGDGSNEAAYQTITAPNSPGGVAQGAGIDPLNPTNDYNQTWGLNSSYKGIMTESDDYLRYRDDLQVMTANIYNGSGNTLHFISGSYHAFGNNGGTAVYGNVNTSSNTAVNDIVGNGSLTTTVVLAALNSTTGSDHLPVVADYSIAIPDNGIWSGGIGNWSSAAFWSNSTVPNSSTVEVKIDNSNATASVVTMDTTATIQDITIDANDTLNITATHALTITGLPVNLFNGTFTNTGALTATSITNTGSFTTTGTFNANGNFNNSGTANFGGTQNWSSGTMLLNKTGTTTFNSNVSSPAFSTLTLNVNVSAGSVVFNASQRLLSLTLANGSSAVATLQANHSNHTLITLGTLSFFSTSNTWQGKLDLAGNDLDVQTASLSTVNAQAKLGFNNGTWNSSNGIVSSAAAADTSHLTALGVMQNNQSGTALYTGNNKFDGTIPGTADILAKYTYYGDANLSGKVDASDYSLIDSAYTTHATGWFNGDFNYDGTLNGSDYTLIDNAFNTQGASLTAALADPLAAVTTQFSSTNSAVPEPTSLVMLTIAAGFLGRRRMSYQGKCNQ